LTSIFRKFICSLQFLTTIPIPGNYVKGENDLAHSMAFYPVVGLILGLISVLLYRVSGLCFIPTVSLVITFILSIILTGGLHIDGFADMCDGFYVGKNKTEILTIMKDSHIGTMAVIGIFCLLILKLSLLYSLLQKEKLLIGLILVPTVSRWIMAVIASSYPYARSEGTAKPFVQNAGIKEIFFSSLFAAIISFAIYGWVGILIAMVTLLFSFIIAHWVQSQIGGVTGDILGGLNEMAEIAALLLLQYSFPIVQKGWAFKCIETFMF
jgi:adenosylcobinamide-GDP ribazoletransferase